MATPLADTGVAFVQIPVLGYKSHAPGASPRVRFIAYAGMGKKTAQRTRIRALKSVTKSAKQRKIRLFRSELERFRCVFAHKSARVKVYILKKC
jgi:hypothetical protein